MKQVLAMSKQEAEDKGVTCDSPPPEEPSAEMQKSTPEVIKPPPVEVQKTAEPPKAPPKVIDSQPKQPAPAPVSQPKAAPSEPEFLSAPIVEEPPRELTAEQKREKAKEEEFAIPERELDPNGPLAGLPSVKPKNRALGGEERYAEIRGMQDASKEILAMEKNLAPKCEVKEPPRPMTDISAGDDVQLGGLFSKKAAEAGPAKEKAPEPVIVPPEREARKKRLKAQRDQMM